MTTFLTLDIEATSFDGCKSIEDMEVIEIGMVCVQDGSPKEEFATFVRPVRTAVTSFCTNLTGITPEMVADAPSFSEAMQNIRSWITSLDEEPTAWCSWGVYDRNHLALERKNHNVANSLPAAHVNAKKVFQKVVMPSSRQVGLPKAIEIAGIDPALPAHRALPDARNVAQVILKHELEGSFHRGITIED